ncbi:toll/interleukin-1 receptor domain-containing protein [Bacillus pseudomycoides]|uniref:Toll/interleukin-1 receptor domain-containing protein n=1 Tax=Bacillus pseudomycoides TaxID=64104 RepID=A0AAJ1YYW8_9BACI|nr:toll/interleukin-1 receptor domain-containing protein [Bacillus pseudomycoides]MDR4325861.1 toll/interleukin-1 receptor domain-containing protein [Bacillus pseudomycoides]MED1535668.1 toll/interleukin-1 receptor domain-containing protein [Bacillus pseudomycoides]PFZ91883.1 hypothetical protein COL70_11595 [Bacillus pseudomycoides]PHD08130.1 hypothetical protein COF46_23755 [Bacillus pseudomycoides]
MASVFLSHSSKDKFFVRKLAERLIHSGVEVWIDEAEIKIGDSLIEKISQGIKGADYLVVILSHNSVSSNWVQRELYLSMTQEVVGKDIKVLPVLIENCEIPFFLSDKLYADFTKDDMFEQAFNLLLNAVGATKKDADKDIIAKNEGSKQKLNSNGVDRKKELEVNVESESLEIFENIRVIGVDKGKTYNPNKEKTLYNVYFNLSDFPSREWVEIFEVERRFPRHSMWRKAWVEENYIVIHCALEEVKDFHYKDILQDVGNTNAKYRSYLKQQAIKKHQVEREKNNEALMIDNALEGLEF